MAAPCLTDGMLSDRFSKNSEYSSSMLELKTRYHVLSHLTDLLKKKVPNIPLGPSRSKACLTMLHQGFLFAAIFFAVFQLMFEKSNADLTMK